jgi:hypothetical protein
MSVRRKELPVSRPKLATNCGSFSQAGFKKHIAECAPCWDDAQTRSDLDFDPSTIANPERLHKQETVCIACNKTNYVDAASEIKAQPCSDCQRTGTLMLRADYLQLSINQIEALRMRHEKLEPSRLRKKESRQ